MPLITQSPRTASSPPPTANESAVVAFITGVDSDPDLRKLCVTHNLHPALRIAAELVMRTFSPIRELHAEIDIDPDTDEERIVLDVTVDGSIDDVHQQYLAYTRAWVDALPPMARERIRLSCHPTRD